MQPSDTVRRLLQAAPGEPLCDACLAFAVQQPLLTVRAITRDLAEGLDDFRGGAGPCVSCRRHTATTIYLPVARLSVGQPEQATGLKCLRCSGVIEADGTISATGEPYHARCLQVLLVDKHLSESRQVARDARRDRRLR
jgi:hypothetical protein